jgi:outer membrane protein assembly factor BamB
LALSLKPGEIGTKLWDTTFTPPQGSVANNVSISLGVVDPDSGVMTFENSKVLKRWGYNLKTGQQLWEGEQEVQFNYYGMSESVYEGKLISYGYGGQLRAYNMTTGDILWTYNATSVGFEISYGGNYPIGIAFIADGKLYTVSSEHSPTQPLWRGPNLRCINATTGEEIWKILFWGARMSPTEADAYIADGIVVGLNYFDMELYAFGKGPSATTVSAPQTAPTLGSSVTITGTVTDQSSSGRRNTNDILDFTLKGTPAISDEDQSAWMEYMFMDQAMPTNAKGVEVSLDTVDPNGNFVHIGTVTSDMTGAYGYKWTPDVPGTYQIIATFAGSKSYGPSYAQTYMTVAEAPPATPPPTEYPQPIDYTWTIIIATVVLLIAMILIGIWIRRK